MATRRLYNAGLINNGIDFERFQTPPNSNQSLGNIKVSYLIFLFPPLMIGICCYSYYLSQYGDEYPFPRATISGTASHYPQDIPFRLIMMTGGSYLHLTYFILNLWLGHLKKQVWICSTLDMVVHFFTQISIVAYMIVASTIDGNGWIPIHRYSAIVFLVSMLINVILNSISLTLIKVRGSTKVVMWSYGIKLFICLQVVISLLYSLISAIPVFEKDNVDSSTQKEPFLNIIEWNVTFGGLAWLFFLTFDWLNVRLCLKGDLASTIKATMAASQGRTTSQLYGDVEQEQLTNQHEVQLAGHLNHQIRNRRRVLQGQIIQ